jgi:hypothetical protein
VKIVVTAFNFLVVATASLGSRLSIRHWNTTAFPSSAATRPMDGKAQVVIVQLSPVVDDR